MTIIKMPTILYSVICGTAGALIAKAVYDNKQWKEQKKQIDKMLKNQAKKK